jgi:acyl-protein synthetase LuxE
MGYTTEFSGFAARVREFIHSPALALGGTAGRDARSTRRQDACATSQEVFERLALELFGPQYRHNAPYRRFCEARGVRPEKLDDWRRIPAIPAAAFKELELSCLRPEDRTAVFHSSGTTGQSRSRHFHNAESLAIYEDSLRQWFGANVLPDKLKLELQTERMRMVFLTPASLLAPHSSLVHMFESVRREFGPAESVFVGRVAEEGAWMLDFEASLAALRRAVREGQPVMLLGTAFSFVHLLDHLADQKLHFGLPPGSLAFETGGYKSLSRSLPKAELHSLIRQRLGISEAQIIREYGMSELGSQAYDWPVGDARRVTGETSTTRRSSSVTRHMRFPPWSRAQIISPETGLEAGEGETGLIRVFDLANVYSVMAVQTEDLGIRRGDGFELIGRAELAEPRGCSLMAIENFAR